MGENSIARLLDQPLAFWSRLNIGMKIVVGVAAGAVVILLLQALIALTAGGRGDAAEQQPAETSSAPTSPLRSAGPTMMALPGRAYKIDDCFGCVTPPGTWETSGAVGVAGQPCRWFVRRDLTGDASSIIDAGTAAAGEQARVAVEIGQYFTSTNCATWRHVG